MVLLVCKITKILSQTLNQVMLSLLRMNSIEDMENWQYLVTQLLLKTLAKLSIV